MDWIAALHRVQLGEPHCFRALFSSKAPYVYLRVLDRTGSRELAREVTADVFRELKAALPQLQGVLLTEERFCALLKELTDFFCTARDDLKIAADMVDSPSGTTVVCTPVLPQNLPQTPPPSAVPAQTETAPSDPAVPRFRRIRLAAGAILCILLLLLL